jgi:protein-S-isoprenylcysteine O-methyltransferase Ste14
MEALYRHRGLIGAGDFLFRYRNAVFPAVMLLLLLALPPRAGLELTGLLLILAGQTLRAATIGYKYIVRGGRQKKVYADDLVTSGFFNVCRNPLYVGNLLIYVGVCVFHGDPLTIAAGAGFFVFAYIAIVAAEEHFLRAQFGPAYEAYATDVPRWLPLFWRLAEGTRGLGFDLKRVINKDYSTCGAWMLALCVLMGLKSIQARGLAVAQPDLVFWTGAGVAALLLILAARGLKKAGRLE